MGKQASGPMTATALIAELERRRRNDPEFRTKVETAEAERAEQHRQFREDEQPVLLELAKAGVEVATVWDLYKSPALAAKAAPTLLSQLALDHPPKVVDGIASALSGTTARSYWTELSTLYVQTSDENVRDRAADLLSGCAIRTHYEDLLRFLAQDALGGSRVYFLRPVHRIGNRMRAGTGRAVITSLVDDAVLGREARAILAGRSRSE